MHAKALSDPIYLHELELAEAATGGALGTFCNSCHGLIAVMSGELASVDQTGVSVQGLEAVSCDFCHQTTGADGRPGNASYLLDQPDGTKRAQFDDAASPVHETAYSRAPGVRTPPSTVPRRVTMVQAPRIARGARPGRSGRTVHRPRQVDPSTGRPSTDSRQRTERPEAPARSVRAAKRTPAAPRRTPVRWILWALRTLARISSDMRFRGPPEMLLRAEVEP